jgi:Na+-transporting methylmalonyl-CoA/oxaloacetate decarboxylase gamma subunit
MSLQRILGASVLALVLMGLPLARAGDQQPRATDESSVVATVEPSTPIELPSAPARPSDDELSGGFVVVVIGVGIVIFVLVVVLAVVIIVSAVDHLDVAGHSAEWRLHHAPPRTPKAPAPPFAQPQGSGP